MRRCVVGFVKCFWIIKFKYSKLSLLNMSWGADNSRTDTYVFLIDSIYFFLGGGGEIILQNSIIVFFIDLECAQYLHLEDESTGCDKIDLDQYSAVCFIMPKSPEK